MRRGSAAVLLILMAAAAAYGQFRPKADAQPSILQSVTRDDGAGLLFGWLDPSRLVVRNSYQLSYTSFGGGQGMSLGTLTSNLNYQISDPLSVSFDVSLLHQPFGGMKSQMSDFSGVYLTRAQLDYRPSKNTLFQIQYRQIPAMYWLNNYGYGFLRNGPASFFPLSPTPEEETP